jgi:alkanesulfonate monooxygenase SsuD/methylene tetrahydromethanopterin reductase-like flavin-dependent oxidoreductase (luciferase family)
LLPRPSRPGGPPILIGGNGLRRTLPLVARFADQWNAVYLPPDKIRERNARLDTLLEDLGREPQDVRRSLMTGCVFGQDEAEVIKKVNRRTKGQFTPEEIAQRGLIVGTPNQIFDQIIELSQVGIERVMLQWMDLDDIDGLEALALGVLPQIS